MAIPSALKTLGQVVLWIFAVVGGITSVAQLPNLWQPADAKTVIMRPVEQTLVSQGVFTSGLEFDGVPVGDRQLNETIITFWRDGGAAITDEMMRRPLEIKMPAGSTIARAEIVEVDSSVPDNFKLSHSGSTVSLSWSVFDPDMAVKIAIARFGANDRVELPDTLGPGVTTTTDRYNAAKQVYWWIALFFGLSSLAGGIILIARYVVAGLGNFIERRVENWHPIPKNLSGVVHFSAFLLTMGGLAYVVINVLNWALALPVEPIPFT